MIKANGFLLCFHTRRPKKYNNNAINVPYQIMFSADI